MVSSLSIFISGNVQGVSFRFFAKAQAMDLDISGWVKNLLDGRVEILAQGHKKNLEKFLATIKTGPNMARVNQVSHSWVQLPEKFPDFQIRS